MDGVVTLLKPPGMTSSNAVYDVRRVFCEKRAGHLGTLDPGAAGVLPVCIGRATRLFDLLVDKEKEYVFEITFGVATDTEDVFGAVVQRAAAAVDAEALRAALPGLLGAQKQTASVYSALKVDGKRMCDRVRAGEDVTPRTRDITLSSLTLLAQTGPNRFLLQTRCSRGTYVRSLCASIGAAMGLPACMSFLLRTAAGPFTLADAFTVQELQQMQADGSLTSAVTPIEQAVSFLPAVTLPEDRLVPTKNALDTFVQGLPDGLVRLYCEGAGFLGVGCAAGQSVRLKIHLY